MGGPAWSDGEDRRTSSGIGRCISRAPGIWAGGTLGGGLPVPWFGKIQGRRRSHGKREKQV